MEASYKKQSRNNELAGESSPYLLQHAFNPVNWYPWGEKALQLAATENKLLIISIGYSACHWCHVMERESFEDKEVAALMNKHFISIKVDREERPDVDQVYMHAAQLVSGQGGWPLNAFALPDGRPFYAGTYFRKKDWMQVLTYFAGMYKNDPQSLVRQAERITHGIQSFERLPRSQGENRISRRAMDAAFEGLQSGLDPDRGGLKGAPKFPMPQVWEYLLHFFLLSGRREVLEAVTTTLDAMAAGGIYDHIGGGFSRYSTDADWHVPHFEKMLYDNAQLVSLYSHAWQMTKNPFYRDVARETLEFIEREMTSPEGGFYSSLDADSEGEEGKYYVWNAREIEELLGNRASLFMDYYNVRSEGNWEDDKNILFRNPGNTVQPHLPGGTEGKAGKTISKAKAVLLQARLQRVPPGLDDKILTSWNALMLKGYVHAYRAFGEERYLEAALRNAEFLVHHAISEDQGINRNNKKGEGQIPGFLDDYAFIISAWIELYQSTFHQKWLEMARHFTDQALNRFSDKESGMFFYTPSDHSGLIARNMEISDNVIPSSNSEMALNLFKLGHYYQDEQYNRKSRQMLLNVHEDMQRKIFYYANWGILGTYSVQPPCEVAILGENHQAMRQSLDQHYLPPVLLSGGERPGSLPLLQDKLIPGQTTLYVCRDRVCKLPVTSVPEALDQINS